MAYVIEMEKRCILCNQKRGKNRHKYCDVCAKKKYNNYKKLQARRIRAQNPQKRKHDAKNTRIWIKKNQSQFIQNQIRYWQKLGSVFNKKWFEIMGLVNKWSYEVLLKGGCRCVICSQSGSVSHHLFEKRYYPKLMLNVNNGVVLCSLHHREVHRPWSTIKDPKFREEKFLHTPQIISKYH